MQSGHCRESIAWALLDRARARAHREAARRTNSRIPALNWPVARARMALIWAGAAGARVLASAGLRLVPNSCVAFKSNEVVV